MRRAEWLRWTVSLAVLAGGLLVTEGLAQLATSASQERADAQATVVRSAAIERLTSGADATDYLTHAIDAFVRGHAGSPQAWEIRPFLEALNEQGRFIRSIVLAPGNRIAYVQPLEGNEAALGLYYPDEPGQWPAIQAIIAEGEPALVGPFELVQGGSGLAYRLPIVVDGDYWGLASTVLDADGYFEFALSDARAAGVTIGVRAGSAGEEGALLAGDAAGFADGSEVETVSVLGSDWEVGTVAAPVATTPAMLVRLVGLLTSTVIASLVFLFIGSRQRRRESVQRLTKLSHQVPGVLYQLRVSPGGGIELPFVSDRLQELFGVDPVELAGDARGIWEQFLPDDALRAQARMVAAASTGEAFHERLRHIDAAGQTRWFLAEASPQREADGSVLWHGFISDVSEEMEVENALRVSASVFDSTRDAVVISDPDGKATDVNPAFTALTGYARDEVAGRTLEMLGAGLTPPEVFDELRESLARHAFWRGELSSRTKDGRVISQAVAITGVPDDEGRISHFVTVISGLDNARDDFVTGLPSRQVLDDRLAQSLERGRSNRSAVALLVVGLDGFRDVNETMGHRVGDTVLKQAAARLSDTVPDDQTVARVGGDEFAIIVTDDADPGRLDELAARCLRALSEPFPASARPLHLTASIGIAIFPEDSQSASELLSHANQALRVAKEQGRGVARYFTASMQADAMERASLADELRTALVEGQLHVVYQPVVDLGTRRTVKVEALVRWTHPVRGPIAPTTFIPVAEKSGLIRAIGDFVFTEAVTWLADARRIAPGLALGFNMSPAEAQEEGARHAERLALLSAAQVPGSALIVEITEGLLLMQTDATRANLGRYRAAGVQFAIDDFGTGYSSLSYLQQLDVDFVKIDRAFVSGLTSESSNRALCEAIVAMSHSLGLAVIAEGIETEGQRSALAEMGCDFGQGYLFARPLPGDEVLARLSEEASG